MKLPFEVLPGTRNGLPRPVADVRIAGDEFVFHRCLLDTGAAHNRFGRWAAEGADIDLSEAEQTSLAIAGIQTAGITVTVALAIGAHMWEAPVTFCDPWPFQFHLLGQEGFFRYFTVTIRASAFEMEVEPDLGPGHP